MNQYTPKQKLSSLRRELAMRKSAYPKWVANGRMNQQKADEEIAIFRELVMEYEVLAGESCLGESFVFSKWLKVHGFKEVSTSFVATVGEGARLKDKQIDKYTFSDEYQEVKIYLHGDNWLMDIHSLESSTRPPMTGLLIPQSEAHAMVLFGVV